MRNKEDGKRDEEGEVTEERKMRKGAKETVLLWQHFPVEIRSDEERAGMNDQRSMLDISS